jgi:hypothetical protein
MSYEGYEQHICSNGHYWITYAFVYPEDKICPFCETVTKPEWSNSVDETNNEGVGYIDVEQFLIVSEEYKICNLGHKHLTNPAIYRIPSKEETKQSRTFRTIEGDYLPLTQYNSYHNLNNIEEV